MPPKQKQQKKGSQVKQQVDQDEEVQSQGSEAKHKTKTVEKQKKQMDKTAQSIQKNQMKEGDQESRIGQKIQSHQQKEEAQNQVIQLQQEPLQQIGQENENVNIMDIMNMSQNNEEKLKQILQDNGVEIPVAQDMLRMALAGNYSPEKLNAYISTISELEVKGSLSTKEQTKLNNNKQWLKPQQAVKEFLDMLSINGFTNDKAAEILLPFADPTFDTTFKMLFGSEKYEKILISLLNNLLGFSGEQEITKVNIISQQLEVSNVSYQKNESGIKGEVDVLCDTANGQLIAIEMQRAKQPYFLARMEYYMSKLIAGQLKEKDTNAYHKEINKTYILVLAKENLFTGQHQLINSFDKSTQTTEDQQDIVEAFTITRTDYEIDAAPKITQTGQIFPDNKMHWKFFELSRFMDHNDSKDLTKNSNLKYQWLEFIIGCGNQLSEPDRHELIKLGYNIMKTAQWDGILKAQYWNEQAREDNHEQYQEEQIREAHERGKWKGEYKGEIGKIKMGIEAKWEDDKILKKLNHAKDKFSEFKTYFQQHPEQVDINDNESAIMGDMNIEYQDLI